MVNQPGIFTILKTKNNFAMTLGARGMRAPERDSVSQKE
jgi:hypothetical protein